MESWVEDPSIGLRGRVDRVDERDGALWVIDLKTGIRQAEVTERQRRQLLLYAALVQRQSGRPVHGIAIEQTSGHQQAEEVHPSTVDEEVAGFQAARESWLSHALAGSLEATAQPSESACRWCPHRLRCDPYWEGLAEDWRHGSIQGRVTSASDAPLSITIAVEKPADAAGEEWTVSGPAPHLAARGGAQVRVVDARPTARRHAFRAEWSTRAQESTATGRIVG